MIYPREKQQQTENIITHSFENWKLKLAYHLLRNMRETVNNQQTESQKQLFLSLRIIVILIQAISP